MTPDLKRLCEAAEAEIYSTGLGIPSDRYSPADLSKDVEAIVRAVLMALPDLDGGDRYTAGEWSRRNADAMASDILAETASA